MTIMRMKLRMGTENLSNFKAIDTKISIYDNFETVVQRRRYFGVGQLPITKTLNLHSATFPVLSEAKYRMLCSPAGNNSPGCFPE